MLANAIPWTKLFKLRKLVKALHKAYRAFTDFMKERRWANRILRTVEEACPVGNSFVPGTLVLMADGTHKPIEQIRPGDKVAATDPVTGRTQARTVVATIGGTGVKHLVRVTVDTDGPNGDRTGTITATDAHPFWVQDRHPRQGPNLAPGHWVDATDLHPGDLLRTPTGTLLPITTLTTWTQPHTVHNLTIDTGHTYYVITGNVALLVHNTSPCDVLPTPQVSDGKLQNLVNDLYKGTTNPARVGDGTTMTAIRQELRSGSLVHGRNHVAKGQQYARALQNWIKRNPNAPQRDQIVARSLLSDLREALAGN
jgi:hypothetical protein